MSVLNVEDPAWKTEELKIFEEQVGRFLDKEAVPKLDKWIAQKHVDREFWLKAGEAGILCASMPEEYGGAGGTFAYEAIIDEALGLRGLGGFGAPLHSGIVAPYILHYGSEEQKQSWLPRLASGELVGAIAMTEPGTGSDLQGVRTTAKKEGNHYVVSGAKTFITNGGTANFILVVAKTDPAQRAKGISLIGIETEKVEGFRRGRILDKMGQPSADTAELFFDDVRVPTGNLLGQEEGQGFFQLMSELPQERLIVAISGQTTIERALKETIAYVKQRNAFGKAIIEFQNTQFKLAEAKTRATASRVFVNYCIEQHLKGKLDAATASMAKLWLTDLENEIVDECLQLFGGYGYMNEYPICRMYTDARVQRIYGGTNEIMKVLIARTL